MNENDVPRGAGSAFGGKKIYIWLIVAGVIILGALLIWQIQKPDSIDYGTSGNSQAEDSIYKNSELIITPTPESGEAFVKLSYGDAIKKYIYRIQFLECHGNPGSISLKRNLPLMLDNRDKKAHTIKVAGKTYFVKSLDYVLSYIGTEGTYNLTCDGGGSASVNIEK